MLMSKLEMMGEQLVVATARIEAIVRTLRSPDAMEQLSFKEQDALRDEARGLAQRCYVLEARITELEYRDMTIAA
jgi:hypothetical protein